MRLQWDLNILKIISEILKISMGFQISMVFQEVNILLGFQDFNSIFMRFNKCNGILLSSQDLMILIRMQWVWIHENSIIS